MKTYEDFHALPQSQQKAILDRYRKEAEQAPKQQPRPRRSAQSRK